MNTHKSFASKTWFEGQVRYGKWIKQRNKPNHYLIYTTILERTKPLTILIKIEHSRDHVLVYHAHVLRKKR